MLKPEEHAYDKCQLNSLYNELLFHSYSYLSHFTEIR
jgi:hypothetical protein